MPKNKGKGGKNRRRGKNENDDVKRNGHLEAFCFDNAGGKKRLCHIRGKLRKKQWINQGDVILVGLRDYQDDKADVIMKYHADEARELKRMHEIPDNINITETSNSTNEGLEDVIFDERHNDDESSEDEDGLPHNAGDRRTGNESPSEDDSDDDEDDAGGFYNPNRMPKKTGNLNARNLIGTKKDSGKGARNNQRDVISGSDSDERDELAHI
ncbi:unnamed protein product [Adineta ricciae]|uniref:S1-like domain-containing protein n=1 Tax=Adineta ricciae TaxID=249248 RepID=A0A814ULF3_ADIRI|nr:unnamed protein product [Adineta ricciae]